MGAPMNGIILSRYILLLQYKIFPLSLFLVFQNKIFLVYPLLKKGNQMKEGIH